MHGDKVKSRRIGDFIEVENVTKHLLNNCVVSLRNIFSRSLIFEKINLGPGEKKKFQILSPTTFVGQWENEVLPLRVYNNHEIIHSKNFNDKTRCFVVISNKSFEKIAEQLIVGLTKFSNADILHYTIGYKSSLDYRYLQNNPIDGWEIDRYSNEIYLNKI